MQANQTQVLAYLVSLPSAFLTTGVYLNVIAPNGTVLGDVVGSASPNTLSTKQSLNVIFTPTMAGLYKAFWKVYVNGQMLTYPANFWVVWTDIYDSVRTMLGANTVNISDQMFDREYRNLDTELHDFAPALPPVYTFNTVFNTANQGQPLAYSDGYEQGMAKLLAARVRPYIGGKRPTGEVSLFKKGTTTVQYTVGSPRDEVTLEERWIRQGMALLEANIPEIYTIAVQDRSEDEMMSRGDLAPGNFKPLGPWDTRLYDSDNQGGIRKGYLFGQSGEL